MNRLLRRTGIVLAVTVLLVPMAPSVASAHVTAVPDEASSPYFRTALRVPHGCDGSATTGVRVQIPEGVENPRPEVVAGWETDIVRAEADTDDAAGDDHGAASPVSEIVWRGGNLPDTHFQEFGLNFRIADDAPEVLWFPLIQECEEGEHRWIEIPPTVDEWGDLDEPAPYVVNTLATGNTQEDESTDAEADGAGDTATEGTRDSAAGGSEGSNALSVIALIAALLGLAAGLTALAVVLRAGRRTG